MTRSTKLTWAVIIVAALLALVSWLFVHINNILPHYKTDIQAYIGKKLGAKTEISTLRLSHAGSSLIVRADDVDLDKDNGYHVHIPHCVINIDWWSSVKQWSWVIGMLGLENTEIELNDQSHTKLLLNGELSDLKFSPLRARMHDFDLHYSDDWPPLKHMEGQIRIGSNGLKAQAHHGYIAEAMVNSFKADVDNWQQPVLHISSDLRSSLQHGKRFIEHSPLEQSAGKVMRHFDFNGPMKLKLDMTIPWADNEDNSVSGRIITHHANAGMVEQPLSVKELSGQLAFDNGRIWSDDLSGIFHGGEVKLDLSTYQIGSNNVYQMIGHGQADLSDLTIPALQKTSLNGQTSYHALIRMFPDNDNLINIDMASNLKGITIKSPYKAYAKNKAKQSLYKASMALKRGELKQLQLHLADKADVEWRSNRANKQQKQHLGKIAPYLDKWGIDQDWARATKRLNIHLKKQKLADVSIGDTKLSITQNARQWSASIKGKDYKGAIKWPKETASAKVNLARLRGPLFGKTLPGFIMQPELVPPSDWHIENITYRSHQLHDLSFNLRKLNDGLSINKLNVNGQHFKAHGRGKWRSSNNRALTYMLLKIDYDDAGELLRQWRVTKSIKKGQGSMRLALSWSGPPFRFNRESLSGAAQVYMENGRIVDVDKMKYELNLGRILTLLNWSNLSRRLRLQFDDLVEDGFAFDKIYSKIKLDKERAFVDRFNLNGPIAKISGHGELSLRQKTYDVVLGVTPNITSSLPLLSAVIWNPVAGAMVYAADKLVQKPFEAMTTWHYHLTGSWQQPELKTLEST